MGNLKEGNTVILDGFMFQIAVLDGDWVYLSYTTNGLYKTHKVSRTKLLEIMYKTA